MSATRPSLPPTEPAGVGVLTRARVWHARARGTRARRLLRAGKEKGDPGDGLRVDAISGVLLISASGPVQPEDATRIEEQLAQAGESTRPVVLDLTRADEPDTSLLDVLSSAWRRLGDRLRVVAPHGSAPAAAIKRAGLRRFAVHASLSGAMTEAGGGRRTRR